MSVENGKVCCNCRHNIRVKDEKDNMTRCYCEIRDYNMSYAQVMEGWCRRWAKEKEREQMKANRTFIDALTDIAHNIVDALNSPISEELEQELEKDEEQEVEE